MKLLIVDDDQTNQYLSQELMEDWGYEYDLAGNGAEAIAHARKKDGQYDICLMDIEMPVMDGLKATKIIRETVGYFPIIAVSANHDYKRDCSLFGIDEFLGKPFDFDMLYRKINEFNVKQFVFQFQGNNFVLKKEAPMDQHHAKELRELAEKDLRKVKFFDNPGSTVIVHKNVTNKISHDFILNDQFLTRFVNRDAERPTMCELYKESNYLMPQTFLMEEEIEKVLASEDKELEKFPEPALKKEKK